MKRFIYSMALAAGLFATHALVAQAPAGAPAGTTGMCNDGTYSSAASKSGACRGHQGVKAWYAAAPAKPAAPAAAPAPAPAAAPAPKPAPVAAAPAPAPAPVVAGTPKKSGPAAAAEAKTAAPGGAPNLVWVNTSSKVYHCYGTTYYGKTKAGAYMSEADAKAKGNHADDNKPCTK